MTAPGRRETNPGDPELLKKVLQAIDDTFRTGTVPEDVVLVPDEENREQLETLLADIAATRTFARDLARGDLSQDLAVKGRMAGCLKALQSNLRHLTWQAGQIAEGDLSQRVDFMGEFSESFNAMVGRLSEDRARRIQREEELNRANIALAEEFAERRKMEDALRESEQRFRTMSETSLTGVYIFVDGVVKYANPTFARILGYTPPDLIGRDPLDFVHPDDREFVKEAMQIRLEHRSELSLYEARLVTRDNRTIFVSIMGVIIPYEGRLAISGNLLDITEQKRAEETLRESEERYRTLFDESPVPLLKADFSEVKYWLDTKREEGVRDFRTYFEMHPEDIVSCGRMLSTSRINRATMTLFGVQSLKEFSDNFVSFFSRESSDAFREELIALSSGKSDFEYEFPVSTQSGEKKTVLLKMIVVPGSEQMLDKMVISLLDITERKKMENALRQANKKITMLSSITRHDIRNQLMALQGYLELSGRATQDPRILTYLGKEKLAAETIRCQIEFTKYYEDLGVNAPEWQDLSRLIHSARSQLQVPDTVSVDIDIPPVKLYADRLIEKVFYNLMENTLRHGERVRRIRISFQERDRGAEIVYEDDGIGISREDKAHLFQKGFGKNTGLGLFLSQEILAITGLTIRETGEPGKGVRFVIVVPPGEYRVGSDR